MNRRSTCLLSCAAIGAMMVVLSSCTTSNNTTTPVNTTSAPLAPTTLAPSPGTSAPGPTAAASEPATKPSPVIPMASQAPAAKVTLKFVKVDSQETDGEDGKGENAVDGNPETHWHTQWQDANPPPPHYIILELVPPSTIAGFTYLPRQDDQVNGTIKDYEFYVSDDGKDFGKAVKTGTFAEGKEKKTVAFPPVKCRFVELKALSEINDQAWTSAAEIGVVQGN